MPTLISEPVQGFSELAGHAEFWRALVEQPGGGPQLQLEHGAGPGAAHRHAKLFQRYSPLLRLGLGSLRVGTVRKGEEEGTYHPESEVPGH